MKKFLSFLVSFALGIILFWAVSKYVVSWQETKTELLNFSLLEAIIILFLAGLVILLETWRWQDILKSKGVSAPMLKLLTSNMACFAIVYLAPIGVFWADFFRAQTINDIDGLSSEKRVASVFIDRILASFFNLIIACLGSSIFFFKTDIFVPGLNGIYWAVIAFFAFIFFFLFVLLFYSKVFEKFGLLKFFLNGGSADMAIGIRKEIFGFFKKQNFKYLTRSLIISIFRFLAILFQWRLLISFLGHYLPLSSSLAIFGSSLAAMETPISADLGSLDLVNALVFEKLGLGRDVGFAFTLILRGAGLFFTFIGIVFLLKFHLYFLRQDIFNKVDTLVQFFQNYGKKRE